MSTETEQNWDELKRMWREEQDAVRTMFPAGLDYPTQQGDNLARLGEAFGVGWEAVAEATMGTRVPREINQWLASNGGRKLSSGFWAFTLGQTIKIPPPEAEPQDAQNWDELKSLWRSQPETVNVLFPEGLAYSVADGENLKKLGEAFGLPWEKIAEATMGSSAPDAINSWLENNGGRKLPSGYWAFTPGQEIQIPPPEVSNVA